MDVPAGIGDVAPREDQSGSVPAWTAELMADMRVLQSELRGLAAQIPSITQKLEGMVPMHEHLKILSDVEELQRRDLGARSDWEEIRRRVLEEKGMLETLWDDRAQGRGAMRFTRVLVYVLGVMVTLLTLFVLIRDLGASVHFNP